MKIIKAVAALAVLAATFAGGYVLRAARPATATNPARRVLYYVDPMHPAYTSDKPGIAPDCGMTLEPVYADGPGPAATTGERKVLYYRDPQQPSYTAAAPGLNPETGNTLEPVYAEEASTAAPADAIHITPERQQLIGVKFATVESGGGSRAIRTLGKVTADETRIGHVHTRIEGWIEKVFVDFTGDVVKPGEPLLTIYSPEMLASQQELLLASRARDLMNGNPLASAAQHGESLFEASRRRLQLWDLSDAQIEKVLASGQPIRTITVFAPAGGVVTARNAFPNQKVTPDTDLYTITDLSRVWIVADVFESDIAAVTIGQTARIAFATGSVAPLTARVAYIQPQVDPTTRTVQVRLEASNPGLRMKPDMFVNVEFGVAMTPQLTVPAGAMLDTGDRQTVFVDRGNGYLEPRQVTIGERFGDRVTVVQGLAAGERVVASGTFLVDSESQLRAAAAGMGAPQHQHGTEPPPTAAPRSGPTDAAPPSPAASLPQHEGHGRD